MPLKKNIIRLLENQDKSTPVSADLISKRLGYPKDQIKKALRELREEEKISLVQEKNNLLYLKNEKK